MDAGLTVTNVKWLQSPPAGWHRMPEMNSLSLSSGGELTGLIILLHRQMGSCADRYLKLLIAGAKSPTLANTYMYMIWYKWLHGLWNPEVKFRIHKGSPTIPFMSRINQIPCTDAYLFNLLSMSHGLWPKKIQLVWRCHQLLSGFLAKGYIPRVTSVTNDKGDNEILGLCADLLAFSLQPRSVGSHSTSGRKKEGNKERTGRGLLFL